MAVFGLKVYFVLPVDEQAFGTCRQEGNVREGSHEELRR